MLGNLLNKKIIELNILSNPNRRQILELVKQKAYSITDISKKIHLSYQNTHAHIKKLEKYGYATTHKQNKSKGRKVLVKAVNEPEDTILEKNKIKLIQELSNQIKKN